MSRSTGKRRRPPKSSPANAPLDPTLVRDALRCHGNVGGERNVGGEYGEIELPEGEFDLFVTALARPHAGVMRMRVDSINHDGPTIFDTPDKDTPDDDAPENGRGTLVGSPVPWYPAAIRIHPDATTRPSRTLAYAAGDFYLQDAGSLLALAACEIATGGTTGKLVCDLCAAPGGKSSAIVESFSAQTASGGGGFLIANEPIRSRHAALAYNLARTGSDRCAITGADPETLADALPGVFDLVLVDAPCSGQALVGRGKQSAGAMSAASIEVNAKRQRRILTAAARLVRPGGRLVYSTCTFAVAENEGQVEFMIRSLGLLPDPVAALSAYASPWTPASYRLWPHRDDCAGSFAASLRSPAADASGFRTPPPIDSHRSRWHDRGGQLRDDVRPTPECRDMLAGLFGSTPNEDSPIVETAIARGWIVDGHSPDAPAWLGQLDVIGPELAHRTGTTWKPSHAAALRRPPTRRPTRRMELDDDAAAALMSGQTVPMPSAPAAPIGWMVACWRGRPLGWIKSDGRIGKNHLPPAARMNVQKS